MFALTSNTASFSERASEAGIVTLQGMVMVFAVLAILWGAVEIMHFVLHRGDNKEKKKQVATVEKNTDASVNDNDAAIVATTAGASGNDGATVAAIMAAISAMRAEEGNTNGFRVVSFKRVERANGRRR